MKMHHSNELSSAVDQNMDPAEIERPLLLRTVAEKLKKNKSRKEKKQEGE